MEVLDLPQPVAVRKPGRGNPASPIAEAVRCLVLLLGCFPAIQPLIAKGLPNTHDGVGHLFRLLDFDLAFRSGDFYPRLAPHLALDYGYATFTFYAPATLYLGEAFRFFGLGYIASLKSLFAVSLLFSALGMYLLGREIYGWRGGLVAALAYVYLPYHLLDVYTRADVGEALGLAWCPFVLWSLWRVVAVPRGSTIGVAGLLLAALVATHNLTALLVAPLLAVVLVVAPGVAPWRRLQASAAVVVLASLLSAFYWVPVLAQLRTIDTSALTSGFFDSQLADALAAGGRSSTFCWQHPGRLPARRDRRELLRPGGAAGRAIRVNRGG